MMIKEISVVFWSEVVRTKTDYFLNVGKQGLRFLRGYRGWQSFDYFNFYTSMSTSSVWLWNDICPWSGVWGATSRVRSSGVRPTELNNTRGQTNRSNKKNANMSGVLYYIHHLRGGRNGQIDRQIDKIPFFHDPDPRIQFWKFGSRSKFYLDILNQFVVNKKILQLFLI